MGSRLRIAMLSAALTGDAAQMEALHRISLRLPAELPEWTSPLVSIVPAQLFSYHLARVKGWDPEEPRGLRKVTETQ